MKKIIQEIQRLEEAIINSLPSINDEIDSIIGNKVTSIQYIERMLDNLLGFIPLGYGKDEFRKLNDYYATFNLENAKCYAEFYREVIEEDCHPE